MAQEFDLASGKFIDVPEKDPIKCPRTGEMIYPDQMPYYDWLENGEAIMAARKIEQEEEAKNRGKKRSGRDA